MISKGKMPRMQRGWLAATALLATAAAAAPAAPITLEVRVFNGTEDVTSQTRIAVHRAGERVDPIARLPAGSPRPAVDVPPGIYDVQAIRERDGRVLAIRWAERLVVMPYPDESGHHLEVINLQIGYGALEVRSGKRAVPEAAVYRVGDRTKALGPPLAGESYLLFVLRAGAYDVQIGGETNPAWQLGIEVPLDRTRLLIAP